MARPIVRIDVKERNGMLECHASRADDQTSKIVLVWKWDLNEGNTDLMRTSMEAEIATRMAIADFDLVITRVA